MNVNCELSYWVIFISELCSLKVINRNAVQQICGQQKKKSTSYKSLFCGVQFGRVMLTVVHVAGVPLTRLWCDSSHEAKLNAVIEKKPLPTCCTRTSVLNKASTYTHYYYDHHHVNHDRSLPTF